MKRKRYTEEQIIAILKEHEAGIPVAELCRRHGVSEQSIYRWKVRFGGMEISDAKRLKELEDENRRLKRMVADLSLDKQMLNGRALKKNGSAYVEASNGRSFDEDAWDQRAPGLSAVEAASVSGPISVGIETRRCSTHKALTSACSAVSAIRIFSATSLATR